MMDYYKKHQEKWTVHAEKIFRDFEAKVQRHDGISILTWTNKNNSIIDNMRFLFDEELGHLVVDGDLGTAVFHFTERATVFSIGKYSSLDYFMEKMVCSTNKWEYHSQMARNQLVEYLAGDSSDASESEDVMKLIDNIMDQYDRNGVVLTSELRKRLAVHDSDYFEWIYDVGKLPAHRVIIWMTALRLAAQQLDVEE